MEPSQEELGDLSLACQRLWDLDDNRLVPGEDYRLNLQEGKRIFDKGDMADEKLFSGVQKSVWERRTYLIFYHLLDNYERATHQAEQHTQREKREEWDFLRAAMATRPMRFCFRYLVEKGKCEDDEQAFMRLLHAAWFEHYEMDGALSTSGFEHVFVGELDDGHVKGLHNWIQTMIEETRGRLEYMGFVLPRRHGQVRDADAVDGPRQLISVQIGWEGDVKDVSSMFVGTSPEFELALYSLCFFAGREENEVQCGGYDVTIKCYKWNTRNGVKVRTCFPVSTE